MLRRHSLWHLDTHGAADWKDPLASCLLLADEERLSLRQLLTANARAELAVLSACETGVPGPDVPDELISSGTGFLLAGAAAVISSLWAVGDLSTALLMDRFYREFTGTPGNPGKAPAMALRAAQEWLKHLSLSDARSVLMDWIANPAASEEVKAALLGQFIGLGPRGDRPFSDPYHWAGFQAYGAAL
jgi:CHAT domain-containing protein